MPPPVQCTSHAISFPGLLTLVRFPLQNGHYPAVATTDKIVHAQEEPDISSSAHAADTACRTAIADRRRPCKAVCMASFPLSRCNHSPDQHALIHVLFNACYTVPLFRIQRQQASSSFPFDPNFSIAHLLHGCNLGSIHLLAALRFTCLKPSSRASGFFPCCPYNI